MPLTNIESSRVFEVCDGRQATSGGSAGAVGGFSLAAAQLTMLWSSGHHIALSVSHTCGFLGCQQDTKHTCIHHQTSFTAYCNFNLSLSL